MLIDLENGIEDPTIFMLRVDGKARVEFRTSVPGYWVHYIDLPIKAPYPGTLEEISKTIVTALDSFECVPYENRSDCEEFVEPAQATLDEYKNLVREGMRKGETTFALSNENISINGYLVIAP